MSKYKAKVKKIAKALQRRSRNFLGGERPRVVMLHHGRCGSSVLGKMLNGHADLHWDAELFHPLSECLVSKDDAKEWSKPLEVVRRRSDYWRGFVYGFETKFKHVYQSHVLNMSMQEYVHAMDEIGIDRWIVLKRANYVRMMLSVSRGMATRKWHFKQGQTNQANPITLDIYNTSVGFEDAGPIPEQFQRIDNTFDEITQLLHGRKALYLEYESDIFSDPKNAYVKACEFLNLRPLSIEPPLARSAFKPIPDLVTNYDELCSILENTNYAWMLERE